MASETMSMMKTLVQSSPAEATPARIGPSAAPTEPVPAGGHTQSVKHTDTADRSRIVQTRLGRSEAAATISVLSIIITMLSANQTFVSTLPSAPISAPFYGVVSCD